MGTFPSCDYGVSDADTDTLYETVTWSVNGAPGQFQQPGVLLLTEGDVVTCTVTVDDPYESVTHTTLPVTVQPNTPPVISAVTILPEPAKILDTLLCEAVASDAEGDPISLTYEWAVNGAVIPAETGATLAGYFLRGDNITCRVSPADWNAAGTPVVQSVTIENSPPTVVSISISPEGTAFRDETITCDYTLTDADADPPSGQLYWTINGTDYFDFPYRSLGSGQQHQCAVDLGGTAVCWGDDTYGQVSLTPNTPRFVQIDAGTNHTCGLTQAGQVECWGIADNSTADRGQVRGTPSTGAFSQISLGADFGCALGIAGNLVCWGDDAEGQISTAPGSTDIAEISTGSTHACTLSTTGEVDCWGNNTDGQVANQPNGTGFSSLALGAHHSCAIDSTGQVQCWGINNGSEDDFGQVTNTPSGVGYVALSSGTAHTCALTNDGAIDCWGKDLDDQVSNYPIATNHTALAAGQDHTCAITSSGFITCWGISDGNPTSDFGQVTNAPTGLAPVTNTIAGIFTAGDSIECSVIPSDSFGAGTPSTSTTITVVSNPAIIENHYISPTPAIPGDLLTCGFTSYDPDGASVVERVEWHIDGILLGQDATFDTTGLLGGEKVECIAFSDDGESEASSTVSITINEAPVVTNVTITPAKASTSGNLLCSYTYQDIDGDPDASSIQWRVNGIPAGNLENLSGPFNAADAVECVVTPNDGYQDGTNVTGSIQINTPCRHRHLHFSRPSVYNRHLELSLHLRGCQQRSQRLHDCMEYQRYQHVPNNQ